MMYNLGAKGGILLKRQYWYLAVVVCRIPGMFWWGRGELDWDRPLIMRNLLIPGCRQFAEYGGLAVSYAESKCVAGSNWVSLFCEETCFWFSPVSTCPPFPRRSRLFTVLLSRGSPSSVNRPTTWGPKRIDTSPFKCS